MSLASNAASFIKYKCRICIFQILVIYYRIYNLLFLLNKKKLIDIIDVCCIYALFIRGKYENNQYKTIRSQKKLDTN